VNGGIQAETRARMLPYKINFFFSSSNHSPALSSALLQRPVKPVAPVVDGLLWNHCEFLTTAAVSCVFPTVRPFGFHASAT